MSYWGSYFGEVVSVSTGGVDAGPEPTPVEITLEIVETQDHVTLAITRLCEYAKDKS